MTRITALSTHTLDKLLGTQGMRAKTPANDATDIHKYIYRVVLISLILYSRALKYGWWYSVRGCYISFCPAHSLLICELLSSLVGQWQNYLPRLWIYIYNCVWSPYLSPPGGYEISSGLNKVLFKWDYKPLDTHLVWIRRHYIEIEREI